MSTTNNDAERSIKKFCVGKKNWQIAATKNGAEANGILYSIAETARANGLRPYYYFKHVLETMIPHMDDKNTDFLEELMPWSGSMQGQRKMSGGKTAHFLPGTGNLPFTLTKRRWNLLLQFWLNTDSE